MTTTYNNSIINRSINSICYGRLTLESGVPVSTTDQLAKTTLYFTPYNGNTIGIYDGSSEWDLFNFNELSLSLSGYTANTNYDIFIYNNGGTLTLESTAWTNDSTRATSLTTQNGIYVKSGATTRRYLGTIRTTATTGQCEDGENRRFVWSLYNQNFKVLYGGILNQAHTYSSTTVYRAWNNNTTVGQGRYLFVLGLTDNIYAGFWVNQIGGANTSLGLDATNSGAASPLLAAINSDVTYGFRSIHFVKTDYISAGYHFLQLQQLGSAVPATFSNIELWSQILC